MAVTAGESPVGPHAHPAFGDSSDPSGVAGNLRQSPHLGRPGQTGPPHWRTLRRPADAPGRPPSQDGEEVAATTQSQHPFPVAANTLDRAFTVEAPNRVWAGDLTYIWTLEGWLYLAVLLDLYSRRVVGWAMGQRLTVDLAERALTMALANRAPTAGLLHHSDRGSPYAATSYQRVLAAYGLRPSMSRKGNCWDNACVESFFGTLKRELVYHRRYATREEATQDIFEYIEVFYNRQRRHSTLGYHSPAEYEAKAAVA